MNGVTEASLTAPGQTTTPWTTGEVEAVALQLETPVKIGIQLMWIETQSLEEGVVVVEGVKGGKKEQRERGEMRGRREVGEMEVEEEIGGKEWRVVIVLRYE